MAGISLERIVKGARMLVAVFSLLQAALICVWTLNLKFAGCWHDLARMEKKQFLCEKRNASGCAGDWTLFQGRCYTHFAFEMSWDDAQRNCMQHSANLASVTSAEVNVKLQELCELDQSYTGSCWIGLHQPSGGKGEDDWYWIADNQLPSYQNWCDLNNEPNDEGAQNDTHAVSEEDVVAIYTSNEDDGWSVWRIIHYSSIVLVLGVCSSASVLVILGIKRRQELCLVAACLEESACGLTSIIFSVIWFLISYGHLVQGIFQSLAGVVMVVAAFLEGLLGFRLWQARSNANSPTVAYVTGRPICNAPQVLGQPITKDKSFGAT